MKVKKQNNNPLVSVIIPAYNAEEYVICALQSLENQTYPNIEAIVVDDGSVDSTYELSKSYTSKKIKTYVFHQENGGVSLARNNGLKYAKGDYLMFLDADDELPSYSIEYLYQLIHKNKASVAIGKLQESRRLVESPLNNELDTVRVWKGTDAIIASMRDFPEGYSVCGKLFSREIVKGIKFPAGKAFHEDSFFCFQCFLKKPVIIITENITYYYRINHKSSSYSCFSSRHLDILTIADEKLQLVHEQFPELEKYASNMILKSRLCFLMNLARSRSEGYQIIQEQCIAEVKKRQKDFYPVTFRNRIELKIIVCGLFPLFRKVYSWIRRI